MTRDIELGRRGTLAIALVVLVACSTVAAVAATGGRNDGRRGDDP